MEQTTNIHRYYSVCAYRRGMKDTPPLVIPANAWKDDSFGDGTGVFYAYLEVRGDGNGSVFTFTFRHCNDSVGDVLGVFKMGSAIDNIISVELTYIPATGEFKFLTACLPQDSNEPTMSSYTSIPVPRPTALNKTRS